MDSLLPVTTRDQIETTARLAAEIWNEHFPPIIGQSQVDYMVERFQSTHAIAEQIRDGVDYRLAFLADRPTAYTALIPDTQAGRLMISKLYVKRAARGKGLGQTMLDFALDQAVRWNCATVWLTVNRYNRSAIDWYLRRGFDIVGEQDQPIGGGFFMNDYVMEQPAASTGASNPQRPRTS